MTDTKKIWRYKLHPDIIDELSYFSKLHEHNDRTDFKEAWKEWLKENEAKIDQENQRLTDLGFDGDLNQKMYVSARYYLKKKKDEKQEPKKRKPYVPLSAEYIELVDASRANDTNQQECYRTYVSSCIKFCLDEVKDVKCLSHLIECQRKPKLLRRALIKSEVTI